MKTLLSRAVDDLSISELEPRSMGPRDVRVRLEASGLCHTDSSVLSGDIPGDRPIVLGHEGVGVVEAVGDATSRVAVGQRVILSAIPSCGSCFFCARGESYLCERSKATRKPSFVAPDGSPVHGVSGLGTLAEEMVLDEAAVVAVDTDLPADQLSVIGCAVMTGTGAVFNTADVRPGQSVVIVGAGGVGLAALQGARARNAGPIVVVDPSEAARTAALALGASHVFAPGDEVAAAVAELTDGRGVDVAFDCVGRPPTVAMAWPLVRKGGDLVMIGVPVAGDDNPIPMVELVRNAKRIVGVMYGSSSMHRDIPLFVRLAETGVLDLAALVGDHVTVEGMHGILCGGHHGPGRTVIDW